MALTAEQIVDLGLRQSRRPQNSTTRAAGLDWLNEGYLKVLNDQYDWSFLRGTGDFTIPTATSVVLITGAGGIGPTLSVLIDRIIDVYSWEVADSYRLSYVPDYDEFLTITRGYMNSTGMPTHWSVVGDNLYVSPTTSKASPMRFIYRIQTPRLALADTPLIPDEHVGGLSSYVAFKNWLEFSGGQASAEATRHKAEFEEALQAMRLRHAAQPIDQMTTGYGEIDPLA